MTITDLSEIVLLICNSANTKTCPITASLYGEMKRYKESEEAFRKALHIHPSYTEAHFNLGMGHDV